MKDASHNPTRSFMELGGSGLSVLGFKVYFSDWSFTGAASGSAGGAGTACVSLARGMIRGMIRRVNQKPLHCPRSLRN